MLFNSYEFILMFLPVAFLVYFLLQRRNWAVIANSWLMLASLFFYAWWNTEYLPLIIISILVNYVLGQILNRDMVVRRKTALFLGIVFNLYLLSYYKYAGFFIDNLNKLADTNVTVPSVILPLGISFFTFTQIAYLVDSYREQAREYSFINYGLFVTFFPHLLAGPIIQHKEIMPQFSDPQKRKLDFASLAPGLFLFFIGLGKKVYIADTFAIWANQGFDQALILSCPEAWITSLSYTLQLYFDFSAYTDMAIGAAMLFNIDLPVNFFSPYKSVNIQEFWRRWHITLGRFFRDYVYIPCGGSRTGELTTYFNLLMTFFLVGLWHGAGWNFILWGCMHGAALMVHRLWTKTKIKIPRILSWFLTFNFVNLAWVFFRAADWSGAVQIIQSMFGFSGFSWSGQLTGWEFVNRFIISWGFNENSGYALQMLLCLGCGIIAVTAGKNSIQMKDSFKPGIINAGLII
ncbi:MAG: MBOAT family protein, partial [Syntrophomonadaceae bacterium]|nr:MBOAT family protein [Syntrophomonadaceae bacterium]